MGKEGEPTGTSRGHWPRHQSKCGKYLPTGVPQLQNSKVFLEEDFWGLSFANRLLVSQPPPTPRPVGQHLHSQEPLASGGHTQAAGAHHAQEDLASGWSFPLRHLSLHSPFDSLCPSVTGQMIPGLGRQDLPQLWATPDSASF